MSEEVKLDVPRYLYHWSPRRNRESILLNGIVRKPSREFEGMSDYVCASRTPHEGWRVTAAFAAAHGDAWDLWLVDSYLAAGDWEPVQDGSEWRRFGVPSSAVALIDQFVTTRDETGGPNRAFMIERDLSREWIESSH